MEQPTSASEAKRRLSIRLPGTTTIAQARQALVALADLVTEVGKDVAGAGGLRWVISKAEGGSFGVEVMAEPAQDRVPLLRAEEAVAQVVKGVARIQEGADRPAHFSDIALTSVRALSDLSGTSAGPIVIKNGHMAPVEVTRKAGANVEEVIGPRLESFGTVEGHLQGLITHDRKVFYIYDTLDGRRIECSFGARVPLDQVLAAFEKRVMARGLIRSRRTGERVSIEVAELRILPREEDLPTADSVRGILKTSQ